MKPYTLPRNLWITAGILCSTFLSCDFFSSTEETSQKQQQHHAYHRNPILTLDLGSTSFSPIDFGFNAPFTDVDCPDGIECSLEQKGERLVVKTSEKLDLLYSIQASSEDYSNSRIVRGPRKQIATLTLPASEGYTNLRLTGDVNNWIPQAMELRAVSYTHLTLPTTACV